MLRKSIEDLFNLLFFILTQCFDFRNGQETSIAEYLFLPRKQKDKKKEHKGSRASRRLLKQQQEKEAAREYAGMLLRT